MDRLEADEEKKLGKWCKENQILYIKFTPFGEKGWPDRICIMPTGEHIWIELKRKDKKPRPLQDYRMDTLRKHGVAVHWTDSAEKAITILKKYRYEHE